jgi:signal transduction histidine kinase
MFSTRTLRGKLTLGYSVVLLIGLIVAAIAAQVIVHEMRLATLKDRIEIATRAIIAITADRNGRLVVNAVDRAELSRLVGPILNAAIVDRHGTVIATTVVTVPPNIRALAASPPPQTTLLTDKHPGDSIDFERLGVTPVPTRERPLGVAVVWRAGNESLDIDQRLAVASIFLIPVIALFAIVAGAVVAARGLRPIKDLSQLASEIEAHDLSRRLALPDREDELGTLCATFDRMLDRLEAAFERERRFTHDASHELRAPLSVIRAEAEVVLRRPRERADYERALRAIGGAAARHEARTRDLLAAARGETTAAGETDVDLEAVARDAATFLEPLAHERGLRIMVAATPGAVVRGIEADVRRATICALHNAVKFSADGGEISVAVERDGSRVTLAIEDDGPGFSNAALGHALERFWRDDPGRSRDGNGVTVGSGLGLAIAGAIVTAAHGVVRLANAPNRGARVIFEFAAAGTGISSPGA